MPEVTPDDRSRRRPALSPREAFTWQPGTPIWYRFAFSAVVSTGVPLYLLAAVGRLDLALYTMAGSMQALFGRTGPTGRGHARTPG